MDLSRFAWVDHMSALATRDDVDVVVELVGGSDGPALALARAGNMAAVREMAGELAVWFAKHTQTLDAALALHMRSVQSDLPARRTHRTRTHPAPAP